MSHEGIRFVSKDEQAREAQEHRPLPRIAVTPEKVRVLLTEGKGLEIDWADGHRSAWSFAWLRDACPCATCVDERKNEGRKPGQAQTQAGRSAAHVQAASQARKCTRRGPLCAPVQLARRPLRAASTPGNTCAETANAPNAPSRRPKLKAHPTDACAPQLTAHKRLESLGISVCPISPVFIRPCRDAW